MLEWDPEALMERINRYAPYVGAGARLTHVGADADAVRVEMPLTDDNKNLVGTHFGGSLYSMVDPFLMLLLYQRLGTDYVVWDKAASIVFVKPGVGTVGCEIRVTEDEVEAIREAVAANGRHLAEWTLEIQDEEGDVVAYVEKTIYVRPRRPEGDPVPTLKR